MKLTPDKDQDVSGVYDESKAMGQASKLNEQDREQSGNLPASSDPVHDGAKPFRITRG